MQKKSAIMARENGGRPEGFSGAAALFCRYYLGGKKTLHFKLLLLFSIKRRIGCSPPDRPRLYGCHRILGRKAQVFSMCTYGRRDSEALPMSWGLLKSERMSVEGHSLIMVLQLIKIS
jgi:hypothetical protein